MPSLKERLEDLPELVKYFVANLASEMGVPVSEYDDNEISLLENYNWPGNVRELKNVIERSLLLNRRPSECLADPTSIYQNVEEYDNTGLKLDEIEKRHILKVLGDNDGNKSSAARILGISRKTLDRKTKAWMDR